MKQLLILFIFLFFSLLIKAQTNYYVNPTGSDGASGTSIATAWKTIQRAANVALPNSIVNIMAGTYNELVTINVSGTSGNPIVFKNYQSDVVVVSGSGFSASFSNLFYISSKNNIVIQGLILENLIAPSACGVQAVSNVGNGIDSLTLIDLKIRNIGFTANPNQIPLSGDNAHGIEIYGKGTGTTDVIKNVLIENCEVYNNINGYSENITVNGNVDGYIIRNNSVYNNTNIGIDVAGNFGASGNPALDHARNGIISGNTVYNNISPVANSSGIYCDGCWNTVIEKNTSHHNTVGITVGCEQNGSTENITVRNNIVHQNTYTGVGIGGYTTSTTGVVVNSTVSNNSFFKNDIADMHGQMTIAKVNNCQVFHNIFNSDGNLLFYVDNINPQNYTSDYNLFYTTAGNSLTAGVNYRWATMSFADYLTLTGKDAHSIFTNPQFVNTSVPNLHLQPMSAAINSGNPLYVPAVTEKDFDGEDRAFGVTDIGADEYHTPLLPVTLISFNASCFNQKKMLQWVTALEINTAYFIVERSTDNNIWEQVGKIIAQGNSPGNHSYSFFDAKQTSGVLFYRLKQVDIDDKTTASKIISLQDCSSNLKTFSLAPNPSSVWVLVRLNNSIQKQQIQFINATGQIVKETEAVLPAPVFIADLPKGIYYVRLKNYATVQKFIKQ